MLTGEAAEIENTEEVMLFARSADTQQRGAWFGGDIVVM